MLTKSKYQEALECIKMIDLDNESDGYNNPKYVKDFYYGECEMLQELVDKAIPKMVKTTIINKKHGSYQCDCPVCGHFFSVNCKDYDSKFCSECGQLIDWSDEDGKNKNRRSKRN